MLSQRFLLRSSVLLVAIIANGGLSNTRADDQVYDTTPIHLEGNDRETKIRETLKQDTTLDVKDTPLVDVLQEIATTHQLQILVDERALDDIGVDKSTPVTKVLKGITLGAALDLILRDLDLTHVIDSEVLMITSIEDAESQLELTIYPVNDLLPEGPFDHEDLIQLIQMTVWPSSWDVVGGPGSIMGFRDSIVVNQTEQVHEAIYKFLQGLRKLPPYEGRAHSKAATKGGGSF